MAERPVSSAAGADSPGESWPEYAVRAANGWEILVRAQPGAKKSEFAGVLDGRLRVRLAAPAVENKANRELVAFVAKAAGLRAAKVRLVSGDAGRQKRLFLETDIEPDWSRFAPPVRHSP